MPLQQSWKAIRTLSLVSVIDPALISRASATSRSFSLPDPIFSHLCIPLAWKALMSPFEEWERLGQKLFTWLLIVFGQFVQRMQLLDSWLGLQQQGMCLAP